MFIKRMSGGLGRARPVGLGGVDRGLTGSALTICGAVSVTHDAGPIGFGLARVLTGAGLRCVAGAPSKLERPSGDRAG